MPADREPAGPPVLDVRPQAAFTALHRRGAANIPLDQLARRIHELPPRDTPVIVFDDVAIRARWAASRLRARRRPVADVAHGRDWLLAGPTESGPCAVRLWQPHALLVEAVRWAERLWGGTAGRRAADLACGTGRDPVWLALHGLDVEAWDILPDALERCRELADRNGARVRTTMRDLEAVGAIESGSFDLVSCFNFLHRPLMKDIAERVRPGGLAVYETFVDPQRELFGKPSRDAHILRRGELPSFFIGWEILISREGLAGERRMAASLVARKPLTR